MQSSEIELTLDDIRLFTSGLDVSEEKDDEIVTQMLETTVKVHMLRCAEDLKVIFTMTLEYMNEQQAFKISFQLLPFYRFTLYSRQLEC